MFTITEKAAEMALFFMNEEGKQGWGVRIYMGEDEFPGSAYRIEPRENPEGDDVVFEKNGLKVFLEKKLLDILKNKQLDYYEKDDEVGFIIKCVVSA